MCFCYLRQSELRSFRDFSLSHFLNCKHFCLFKREKKAVWYYRVPEGAFETRALHFSTGVNEYDVKYFVLKHRSVFL